MEWLNNMKASDWVMIFATLAGPILAVQAQKWLERAREKEGRRVWVFQALMATRGARLSAEHVRALNTIDIAFYGVHVFGKARRSAASQRVLDNWREYHRHFGQAPAANIPNYDSELTGWVSAGNEKFLNLLESLASATNHAFDREALRDGSYTPIAHGRAEQEQDAVRLRLLEVLGGEAQLSLNVKSLPIDPKLVQAQQQWQMAVASLLEAILAQVRGMREPPAEKQN